MLKKLMRISIIKTLRMNLHYFGLKGLFHPYIIASKNVRIISLKGSVIVVDPSLACIHLGFNDVGIFDTKTNRLLWENNGTIVFHKCAAIGFGSKISCKGKISFGRNFQIVANSSIIAQKEVTFGDDVLVSWDCLFMDTDFHKIHKSNDVKSKVALNPDQAIGIGSHVWVGCRATILKGTEIPNDCVVAAGSVLHKKYRYPNSVINERGNAKSEINWSK